MNIEEENPFEKDRTLFKTFKDSWQEKLHNCTS